MIDWVSSKMGLMIFIILTAAVLFMFVDMQLTIFEEANDVQIANDLCRITDNLCIGCSTNFTFLKTDYNLEIKEFNLTFNDVTRQFSTEAVPIILTKEKMIKINNTGGKVYFDV